MTGKGGGGTSDVLGSEILAQSDFFGWKNSEVVIFLSIKYEPLSGTPIIKICEWGPLA